MNDKKYLLDGEPVSAMELIQAAKDAGFEEPSRIYTTSWAATLLRSKGHTVETNPDYLPS